MAASKFVIVGAGLAGAKAAEALRASGFDGRLTLIGEEAHLPYERPPLSKDYLIGKTNRDSVFVHDGNWYAEHGVDLRLGVAATGIDRAARQVALADGSAVGYDKLLLATGASPRRLPHVEGVHYLRTISDCDRIRDVLASASHLAVIGGGWIGLEVTAAARHHGNEVTVVEPQPTPLHGVLGPEMGGHFARLHRDHGVTLLTGTTVRELRGTGGRVSSVVTDGHAGLPADLVVVGIGAAPNAQLAAAAGLEVDNGVVVDEALRSATPDVFAAGDVASSFHPLYGRYVRVEHWANALNGGPAAARSMLGRQVSYDRVPYFYTDQYELGMEYSGLGSPSDRVVCRGNPDDGEFIAFWLSEDGRVTAGMNVNVWDVTAPIQALIRSRRQVHHARLADPDTPLEVLAS